METLLDEMFSSLKPQEEELQTPKTILPALPSKHPLWALQLMCM